MKDVLSIDLQEQMYATNATCYIRIPFEVEADALASADMLISVELDGMITKSANEFPFDNALALLDGLRVTELMYHASAGSSFDYIKL